MVLSRLMLLLFSTVACSRNMPQENVAARVFEEPITAEQVRRYVHDLPEELRVSGAAGDRPREYLQPLIDRKLLVHEARARNLEDDLDYLRWHRQTVHNPAIWKVVEASAGPALEIGDAELRRYCESTQCDRQCSWACSSSLREARRKATGRRCAKANLSGRIAPAEMS